MRAYTRFMQLTCLAIARKRAQQPMQVKYVAAPTAFVVSENGEVLKCQYILINQEFSAVLFDGLWRIVKTSGEGDPRFPKINQWFPPKMI
jgi:hypothetical protein